MTDNQIIKNWLSDVQKDLIINYDNLGLRASGNWANTLEQFNDVTARGYHIGIKGERYTGALENGRSRNSNQSPEALEAWVGWAGSTILAQWVEDKGLNINPFAVAWNIARNGWTVPNQHNRGGLVSNVVTTEKVSDLNRKLVLNRVDELRSDLIERLK